MLKNYVKIAFRNLIKHKVYTGINVMGLAVSITACLLIVLYVRHELSYDKFFPNADRIYKFVLERKYPNHSTHYSIVPHSFAKVMQQDFPEVESAMHLLGPQKNAMIIYKPGGSEIKSFDDNTFVQADSSFFDFFNLKMISGNEKTALSFPNQVIISQSMATKIFGNEDPIGKILEGDRIDPEKVAGVFQDIPGNSHLKFDMIVSLAGKADLKYINSVNFTGFDFHIYIKLKPNADWKALEKKFPEMVDRYAAGSIEHEYGKSWADYKKDGNGYTYTLQPLKSIHLDPTNMEWPIAPGGNLKYVYILSTIALLIVLLACINFMNLATARSAERAREVGVRKVMGSLKGQLMAQYLTEAIILSFIGTLIAILGVFWLLPFFNDLVEKQLHFILTPDVVGGLLGFALLVGVLAGLYPAFVLSNYNPVVVMKGSFSGSKKGAWLRNGLVVFQFMISITLIVSTMVVGQQMSFIQKQDLGFDKKQLLMIKRSFALNDKTETFIDEIRRMPEVKAVAGTSAIIGNRDDVSGESLQPEGSNEILTVKQVTFDDDFANVIGVQLEEGKFFSKQTNDSLNVILNETAVRTMRLSDPIGRKLWQTTTNGDGAATRRPYTIIGIVKDFHFQSLRDEITPLVIYNLERVGRHRPMQYVAVRLKPDQFKQAIGKMEGKWKEFVPTQPFKYEFLDDNLSHSYAEEQRSGKMFALFSALAIVIACVGLFGLSAYTASLRTKEIGIRKVLGSSVGAAVILLSKDFTKLVFIAFILAVPLSWWMMNTWLNSFAYRINLTAGSFILAGSIAIVIAWITVSYQSIKAAVVNPINSLRG